MREAKGDPKSQIGLKRMLGEELRGSPPSCSPVFSLYWLSWQWVMGSSSHTGEQQSQLLFHGDNSKGQD